MQSNWKEFPNLNSVLPLVEEVQKLCSLDEYDISVAAYDEKQTDYFCSGMMIGAGGHKQWHRLDDADISVYVRTNGKWEEEKCTAELRILCLNVTGSRVGD